MELEELLQEEKTVSLEDLVEPEEVLPKPSANTATITNKAAYVALMQEGNARENFVLNMQPDENGQYSILDQASESLREDVLNTERSTLQDILLDESLDLNTKRYSLENLKKLEENVNFDYMTNYATQSLAQPVKDGDEKQEEVRFNFAEILDETIGYKKEIQRQINGVVATNDAASAEAMKDFLMYLAPFAEGTMVAKIADALDANDSWAATNFMFRGSARQEMLEAIRKMPLKEQAEAAGKLAQIISSNTSILGLDDNDVARTDFLRTVFEDGYYGDVDKFIDNVTGVLDIFFGLGSMIRGTAKTLELADKANKIRKRRTFSETQPASPSQVAKETNPQQAKEMHEAVVADETGEVAKATHGTTRDEAILFDEGAHPLDDVQEVQPMVRLEKSTAGLSDRELEEATQNIANKFREVDGVVLRSMQVGRNAEDIAEVRAVYSAGEAGWKSPEDAIESVYLALRKLGVEREDLRLMQRTEKGYEEVTLAEVIGKKEIKKVKVKKGQGKGGTRTVKVDNSIDDYVVGVRSNKEPTMLDVTNPERYSIGLKNFFDRVPLTVRNTVGSITRHLFDPASLFPRFVVGPALEGVDRAAALEQALISRAKVYTKTFLKLPFERQNKIDEFIRKSNHEGTWDYSGEGFTKQEKAALDNWRDTWDNIYFLENEDARKSLTKDGYQRFIDMKNDSTTYAKPLSRNAGKSIRTVYDPETDSMRILSDKELDEIYDAGGEIAELKQGMEIDGTPTKFIVSRNNGSQYLKELKEGDTVLEYRKGYYTVRYDAPFFIYKKVKGEGGLTYEKTVAVAGNKKEANRYLDNLPEAEKDQYGIRTDVNQMETGSTSYWDIQQSVGRSTQKFRGERLQDASGTSHLGADHSYVKSPIDSLLDSTRSIATRTALRDTIINLKTRFMKMYKDELPPDALSKGFPSSASDIGREGARNTQSAADARTLWEYINYLENGYVNHIDKVWKDAFNAIADNIDAPAIVEKGLRVAGKTQPAAASKNLAFQLYLALNPLRQAMVQSNQAFQMGILEPKYFASQMPLELSLLTIGRFGRDHFDKLPKAGKKSIELLAKQAGMSIDDVFDMAKQYEKSGLSAAIDKTNLVRESMKSISDQAMIGNPKKYQNPVGRVGAEVAKLGSKGLLASRKMGFDFGEEIVMTTAWLTMRHRALKGTGRTRLTAREASKTAVDARVYTGSMNAAGDMPYNQNLLSVVFQFFQVPHKMILNMSSSNIVQQKKRLFLTNMALYSLPQQAMYELFGEHLPEDETLRNIIVEGAQGFAMNELTNWATGEEGRTDFSSIAPLDAYGVYDFISGLLSTDLIEMVSATPSGSLFFGNDPRISNLFETIHNVFIPPAEIEDPRRHEAVIKDVAELTSGMSNYFKAKTAYEEQLLRNSKGVIIGEGVSSGEHFWKLFGFRTAREALTSVSSSLNYEDSKEFKDDVKQVADAVSKYFADFSTMKPEQAEYQQAVLSHAINLKKRSPTFRKALVAELQKRAKDGRDTVYQGIMDKAGFRTYEQSRKAIMALPIEEEQKQELLKRFEWIKEQIHTEGQE